MHSCDAPDGLEDYGWIPLDSILNWVDFIGFLLQHDIYAKDSMHPALPEKKDGQGRCKFQNKSPSLRSWKKY